ncbi:MAG: hypothetical protein H8E14_12555 [Candidatus Marinimicrobia bacterium]|nr:hypothetical protein [Candidatus Neomarinimicrobiota bacterium]
MADDYYKMAGWDWAKKATGESIFGRLNLAGSALDEISQVVNHPLYHRAIWYMGKISFWDWVEEHGSWQKAKAEESFAILKQHYPDHRLLRMYMGEQFAFPEDSELEVAGAPQWAMTANRALNGLLDVIYYWVDNRQAENGEFGGKYDDDVEMLRWWPVARLAADDQKTLLGMQRLVNGVWNSDWIVNGFSRKVRDVEHAAEPVADTQPMMIGLDYGNPVYVERCMQSAKGLDLWTGFNSRGHRHFKSSWYSATELDLRPPRDCDVPMNARTIKAVRWLAWYNRHPLAIQFLREWADAWLEDCLRTDKGKPYGIVPSAIRFEDDAIGGHADNWHHPGMFWHYYDFRGGNRMLQQFLATYLLIDDPRYLEPIEAALKLVKKFAGQDVSTASVGSEAWVVKVLRHSHGFSETIEQWRLLIGDTRFDDLLIIVGSDYLKFRLTGDRKYLIAGSEQILNGTKYNRELITTEAYFTDRVDIGNIHENRDWAGSHLESMYTGNSLLDGFYPFYNISWSGLDADFAAVVLESNREQLRVLVYNFAEEARAGTIHFWTLAPGKYEFRQGVDQDDDGILDIESLQDEFIVQDRIASHTVILPSRTPQIIEVQQKEAWNPLSVELADLAIVLNEVRIITNNDDSTVEVVVPVHNIGIIAAIDFMVELQATVAGDEIILAQKQVAKLEAPLDLQPKIVEVSLKVPASQIQSETISIVVDPTQKIEEITEVNNRVVINPDRLRVANLE